MKKKRITLLRVKVTVMIKTLLAVCQSCIFCSNDVFAAKLDVLMYYQSC